MPRASTLRVVVPAWVIGAALGSCAPAATSTNPVTISPRYYTVLLDSNHVRVLEYRLRPGQQEPMHTHPRYVVYFFQAARIRATTPDGHNSEVVVTPGETLYRDALAHAIENVGNTEVHALLIELERDSR